METKTNTPKPMNIIMAVSIDDNLSMDFYNALVQFAKIFSAKFNQEKIIPFMAFVGYHPPTLPIKMDGMHMEMSYYESDTVTDKHLTMYAASLGFIVRGDTIKCIKNVNNHTQTGHEFNITEFIQSNQHYLNEYK